MELELTARKSGTAFTTNVKILNDSDVALYKANLTTNANSLSIDYGRQSVMQQAMVTLTKNAVPLIGLMFVGAAATVIAARKYGSTVREG